MFITFIRRTCVVLVLVVLATTAIGHGAQACPGSTSGISSTYPAFPIEARSTDPVGPFPLAALVPFPWSTIQGIWELRMPNSTNLYFSFEVQSDCAGRKFVQVLGFDQKTYRVTDEGIGLGELNDQMVRAVMTAPGYQYMLYIRQFKIPQGFKGAGKISTVVTIRSFDSIGSNNDRHVFARRVSDLALKEYVEKRREDEKRQADRQRRALPGRP